MSSKDKSAKTSKRLIWIIFILLATAGALKMYNPASTADVNMFEKPIKDQISIEIRNNQSSVSESVTLSDMTEEDNIEKIYYVRLNHEQDAVMLLKPEVVSAKDGIDEALNVKIYNEYKDEVMYEGSLKNVNEKVLETPLLANASEKNDVRFRIYFYFEGQVDDQYQQAEAEVKFTWYVSDEDQKKLAGTKTGDVKIILYSFVGVLAVIIILLIAFRKKINPEVFRAPDTEDNLIEEPEDN